MAVVARMYVESLTRQSYNREQVKVQLRVVSRGEHNKEWSAMTPTGSVDLGIMNPAAAQQFVDAFDAGQEFLVTFALAPEEPE